MPHDACVCKAKAPAALPGDGKVRVSRDSKGRGGKVVTVVRGLPLDAEALAVLGKELRSACGAGGTVRDGVLEIQGDHVTRVLEMLNVKGWQARQSGG
jgi:translation initiation factor 1